MEDAAATDNISGRGLGCKGISCKDGVIDEIMVVGMVSVVGGLPE
jgi:hypothetical protein